MVDAPRIGAIGLFFAIASLGLPGLGNFVGEFLVLFGTYRVASGFAIVGTLGLVVSTIYALSLRPAGLSWRAPGTHGPGRLLVAPHDRHGDDDRDPRLARLSIRSRCSTPPVLASPTCSASPSERLPACGEP